MRFSGSGLAVRSALGVERSRRAVSRSGVCVEALFGVDGVSLDSSALFRFLVAGADGRSRVTKKLLED